MTLTTDADGLRVDTDGTADTELTIELCGRGWSPRDPRAARHARLGRSPRIRHGAGGWGGGGGEGVERVIELTIRPQGNLLTVDVLQDGVWMLRGEMDAAAALELAARLREAATSIHPHPARCPTTAHDGARCLGGLGHEGKHWTAAGWFGQEGDVERAR